eukprot:Clim_evm3s74 gene=Clim_evmTU3s74
MEHGFVNHYEILGIVCPNLLAGEKIANDTIRTAYRRLALQYHPDKNQGNPTAIAKFHSLSASFEVLNDRRAREAFDAVLKSKQWIRHQQNQWTVERQKLRADLERREAQAQMENARAAFEVELNRIREDNHAALKQFQRTLQEEIDAQEREDSRRRALAASQQISAQQASNSAVQWQQKTLSVRLKPDFWSETCEESKAEAESNLRKQFNKVCGDDEVQNIVIAKGGKKVMLELKSNDGCEIALQASIPGVAKVKRVKPSHLPSSSVPVTDGASVPPPQVLDDALQRDIRIRAEMMSHTDFIALEDRILRSL